MSTGKKRSAHSGASTKAPFRCLRKGKDVMVGAIDVANEKIEKPEEVARTIRAAMKFVAPEKLYPCTNCGMVPLPRQVALAKLKALAAGAAIVRAELGTGRKKK